jgi:hypothetical protein
MAPVQPFILGIFVNSFSLLQAPKYNLKFLTDRNLSKLLA